MANSMYFSNLVYNKENDFNNKNNNANQLNMNVEIEKFVMQYEDKIYFYDVLYEYMENFLKLKKIKFNQNIEREKPQKLGLLIESILKDWLKARKSVDKYKNQLKMLLVR